MFNVATVLVLLPVVCFCLDLLWKEADVHTTQSAWQREPGVNPQLVVKHLSPNWLKWRFNSSLQTPVEALMCEHVVEQVPAVGKSDHSWLHTHRKKNLLHRHAHIFKWRNKTHTECQELGRSSRNQRLESLSGWSGRSWDCRGEQVGTWLTPGCTNQLLTPSGLRHESTT